MKLEVRRKWATDKSTISYVFVNDRCQCYGLEPPIRTDDIKPRAIPAGTYELKYRWSEKHKRNLFHVENVPGFTEVEIHIGNYAQPHVGADGEMKPADTIACLCVGETRGEDFVGNSHGAFEKLMVQMIPASDEEEPMTITYTDPEAAAA